MIDAGNEEISVGVTESFLMHTKSRILAALWFASTMEYIM